MKKKADSKKRMKILDARHVGIFIFDVEGKLVFNGKWIKENKIEMIPESELS